MYANKGEWNKAIEYYEKSLRTKEKLGDVHGIAQTYNNLGLVYANKGEWNKAIEYYEKSLETFEKLGDKQGMSITLNNLGEVSLKNGNWEKANDYLKRSIAFAEELAPISTVEILANFGVLLELEDQYSDAIKKFKRALDITINVGATPIEIDILEKLADVYIALYRANNIKEDLSSAEQFYNQAYTHANNLSLSLQKGIAARGIGIVQVNKKEINEANKSFKKSIEILHHMEAKYELQKTLLEYGRALYENNSLIDAELMVKAAAFDCLHNDYSELSIKAYLLLGDIVMKHKNQYTYYLDALNAAKLNPKIYAKTSFLIIFRMKKMNEQILIKFIKSLKTQNKDEYFNCFLDILNAKIECKDYDITALPIGLAQELETFSIDA